VIIRKTSVDDIINDFPESGNFFFKKGVRYIRCGEVSWEDLETLLKRHEMDDEQIDIFLKELNEFLMNSEK